MAGPFQTPVDQPQDLGSFLQMLQAKGQAALDSGQITPAQAQQHLAEAGPSLSMAQSPTPSQIGMGGPQPGRKAMNTVTSNNKTSATANQNTFKSNDEFQRQLDMLRNTPEAQAVNQSDQDLQNQIRLSMSRQVPDNYMIKPLLAFVDSQTGSNLSKGYTEGATKGDINAQLLKYQDELAKRKQDTFKSLLSGLGALKNGSQSNVTVNGSGQSDMTGFGGAGTNQGAKAFNDWYHTLQADKSIGTANATIDAADLVARHLAAGGSINAVQAQVGLLRGAGLSRITNTELANTVGNRALADRLAQQIQFLTTGDLTESNKAQYMAAAKAMSENAPAILEALKRQHELSAQSYGVYSPQTQALIDSKFNRIAPGSVSATPQVAPGGPKIGTIEDGHEFLGGNPADPKAWKAVK